ncbi:metallophosphoesterase [Oceanobacillus piezotolerans]|uniref:Metallophosphoesterase n=1 Tax=Oceanobacillus piezotolerans TaxID=2448030 RepID=A0A498D3J5_9BACI|nr:metallophosphoesterase [Oceanobacillus piezotolerans]RLL42781.1 metallophosphoesterase [Oceanobacillus piezotolerans]
MMKKLWFVVLLLLIMVVVYTIWDNNRFIIVEEEIEIDNLPPELEGIRILQISDMHEKEFGKGQTKLIKAINQLEYDVIVFTGDMLDDTESKNYTSFYALIEGINNKEFAWFVPGNTDPESYSIGKRIEKSEFIKGMEERGVSLLESMDSLTVGDRELYFTNLDLSIISNPDYIGRVPGVVNPEYAREEAFLQHQEFLWKEMMQAFNQMSDSDVLVGLNHYPVPDNRIDSIKSHPDLEWRNMDLIIAGHYHGGQIRLPIVGALFIPEPWHKRAGLFPPNDRVKGLWEYEGTKQYVSTGLGSSDAFSFLDFRLFNTPEINVLTLKRE